ncbi:hypothetical protein BD309DRAFT_763142 [Dichomitus squalens]|nr:hypothetical protein BD309DRAFT_763142 [Dichomitus squalens]
MVCVAAHISIREIKILVAFFCRAFLQSGAFPSRIYGVLHRVSHSFTIYIIPIVNGGASLYGRTIPRFLPTSTVASM